MTFFGIRISNALISKHFCRIKHSKVIAVCKKFQRGLVLVKISEAALHMCSCRKVFRKYAANLQENIHAEHQCSLDIDY